MCGKELRLNGEAIGERVERGVGLAQREQAYAAIVEQLCRRSPASEEAFASTTAGRIYGDLTSWHAGERLVGQGYGQHVPNVTGSCRRRKLQRIKFANRVYGRLQG